MRRQIRRFIRPRAARMFLRLVLALLVLQGIYPGAYAAPAAQSAAGSSAEPPAMPQPAVQAPQPLTPQDSIVTDTTWRQADSPYTFATDMIVSQGVTLTIEPGVVVRFGPGAGLQINGNLQAVGSAAQPILLTGTSQTPGAWDGLALLGHPTAPAGARLEHVTVEYGGGVGRYGDIGGNIYISNGLATIRYGTLRASARDGLYVQVTSTADIADSALLDNASYAVQYASATANASLANLTATGNGTNAISLGQGSLSGTHTWENAGLEYIVTQDIGVQRGATLVIEPGVVVKFAANAGLRVDGRLLAEGSPLLPIVLTGLNPQPGAWDGILLQGGPAVLATVRLHYVTLEYGGGVGRYGDFGANLFLNYGVATILHSTLRGSARDGIYAAAAGNRSVVENSQILDHAGYGIRNVATGPAMLPLLASNNWWGSPAGPTVDDISCGPGGSGSRISNGVVYLPVQTSAEAEPTVLAPGGATTVALSPHRWIVPADGVVRAWVTMTVRDGSGQPLPNREVSLLSTRGTVVQGVKTNAQGQADAYVVSAVAGEAELTAALKTESACEFVRPATATILFTADPADELLPNAAAPYATGRMDFDPMPITQGTPTRIRARLTNPNPFDISVNATFGLAQLGVGLTFGPVGEILGRVIPANSDATLEAYWVPPVSGHLCIRLEYSYQAAAPQLAGVASPLVGRGSQQDNRQIQPPKLKTFGEDNSVVRARKSINAVNTAQTALDLVTDPVTTLAGIPNPMTPSAMAGHITDAALTNAERISHALQGGEWQGLYVPGANPRSAAELSAAHALATAEADPADDYATITLPQPPAFTPIAPSATVTPEHAAAATAFVQAFLDFYAKLVAAAHANVRLTAATLAGDNYWAYRQASALVLYKQEAGDAAILAANSLDTLLQYLRQRGAQDLTLTVESVVAYQERLRTQGFTADEIAAFRQVGLLDSEIERVRQYRMTADPAEMAGSVMARMADLATALREMGGALAYTPPPLSGIILSGRPGVQAGGANLAEPTLNLARVYASQHTFQVGNPFSQTTTIELQVRRLDLPADWMVTLDPPSVTLAPGAQTTVTATLEPGSATAQGSQIRFAVEGYVNGQLLRYDGGQSYGGVVMELRVPQAVLPAAWYPKLYLPTVLR